MCGIVGLLVKRPALRDSLGAWLSPMLICMGDRGPDSAGLAVFSDPVGDGRRRFSLYAGQVQVDWLQLEQSARRELGQSVEIHARHNHAVLTTSADVDRLRGWLAERYPSLHLLSVGRSIDLYKDTGHPRELADRYAFGRLSGTHAVGHTRMATESAVTPAHAHPFTAGEDFCLVHNGSLSNPNSIRRKLEKRGIRFETDNDTEAACRFLEWRMSEGDSLEAALEKGLVELDGFFTLLMATGDKLVLVRDAFACKPAVAAETDDYVAISSEFRSLAHLPGIRDAEIFEPGPERIYSWTVSPSLAG
ncbi:MAG TPA: class II glutamine amidotransferase [Planctomycetaceae bacterium]|nr:class II glutamine amidotransferase [Planctomycetaceae bacterium]